MYATTNVSYQWNSLLATFFSSLSNGRGDSAFLFSADPATFNNGFPCVSSGAKARGASSASGFGSLAGGVGRGREVKKRC